MISTTEAVTSVKTKNTSFFWLKQLIVLLLVVALSLVSLEIAFYFAGVGESDYLVFDKLVGYKPMAGKRVTSRQEGFSSLTMNSFGMQNDEISLSKGPDVLRVAVFGDSFVEALQVPRQDNYCSLLQEDLKRSLKRPVEVLNFGVANYSVAQDYLRYVSLARKFKPDVVVLAYRVSETEKILPQAARSLAFVRPVLFVDGDKVRYDDSMVQLFGRSKEQRRLADTDWLRRHSRIWGVVGKMQAGWMTFWETHKLDLKQASASKDVTNRPATSTPGADDITATGAVASEASREAFAKCYWSMADAQLRHFAGAVKEDGGRFYILRTPFTHGDNSATVTNKVESALLQKTATTIGAGYIDVESPYREEYQRHCPQFFLEHGHFNKRMHARVARQLNDKLARDLAGATR